VLLYLDVTAQKGFQSNHNVVHPDGESWVIGGFTNMYAVFETGGKQYKVAVGDNIFIERLELEAEDKVTFDKVVFLSDDKNVITIGAPYVDNAKVTAKVVKNGKSKKIIVYKYKAKKGYHKKQGHRQPYSKVEITGIKVAKPKAAKEPAAEEAAAAE